MSTVSEEDTAIFPVITMPLAFPGHSEPCRQVQLVNVCLTSAHPFTFLLSQHVTQHSESVC